MDYLIASVETKCKFKLEMLMFTRTTMKMLIFLQFIQTAASILNPYSKFTLFRNPRFRNSGKFITLPDFLAFAKNASTLSGVLIHIEVRDVFVKIKYSVFKILGI